MKFNPLHNFISPVTGKLLIEPGYTFIGDQNGRSFASPILLDIRQDIVDLKKNFSITEKLIKLDWNNLWIGDINNNPIQTKKIGVINLPMLGAATFPYPDFFDLPPVPIPNPTFNPVSGFDWLMSGPWLPQIYAGSSNTLNTSSETVISAALAMTQVKVAQAIKRLDVTGFIVKNRNINFTWENPSMVFIPDTIKQLYGLSTNYTFTNAQALNEIGEGLLKNSSDGTLSRATLTKDKIWKGNENNEPVEIDLPTYSPKDASYILKTANSELPNAQALNLIGSGILKISSLANGAISIASEGMDYVTPGNLVTQISALEAAMEAQITAVTGYLSLGLLTEFLVSIGWSSGYSEYLWSKYKPLRTDNRYEDTDDYSKQAGNIWFDANHIGAAGDFKPGLRVTSWDSSVSITNDLFPVSMGLFGYKNQLGYVPAQEGFVWQSYIENNSSNAQYRFPKNFGLYYVGHDKNQIGWNRKEILLLNYDFYNEKFTYEKQVEFKKDIKCLSSGAIKLPGGSNAERLAPDIGMLRYNNSVSSLKLEYADGTNYYNIATENMLLSSINGPCLLATTTNLICTYLNGSAGVSATLTNASTQTALSIDSNTVTIGNRILVKNQTSAFQNGVYTVTNVGSVSTNWVLTRAIDYNAVTQIIKGQIVNIISGTINSFSTYMQTEIVTNIGTDNILFTILKTGLRSITGTTNQISVATSDNIATVSIANNPVFAGTESVIIPTGTTAQKPASAIAGMLRFNTSVSALEYSDGTNWGFVISTKFPYLFDAGLWLRSNGDTNHGMIYNSTIDGPELRGFQGCIWKTGSSGATERMRLTNSGLDVNNLNIKRVADPILSTDAVNYSFLQTYVTNNKLLFISNSSDQVYPINITRSVSINNTYISAIRESGTYSYLNSGGSVGVATDSPTYDLKCNGRIRASELNIWSSKNIKNILEQGEQVAQEASYLIENIPIAKYNFKDTHTERTGEFFGVISEQILDYLPQYVSINEFKFVPDIMMKGILNNLDNFNYFIILDKPLQIQLNLGDKIQIIIDNSAVTMEFISIHENVLKVKVNQALYIKDKNLKVFVYGTYKDCPTVSVKHLAELALCALQNCIKRIIKLENKL